ncbi:entry exclusion lipoprotein TrbK [Pseudomonas sp. PDM20]|uniref:entry exclusion lipoprotein TrbK n=1 Tax=Pseudomonas sp. PDM20 TaxID=2769254 RepID=UPI001780DEEA|nr:entry exclusion lipoprotein TrbK [Pseudomonas sp. PDM20]
MKSNARVLLFLAVAALLTGCFEKDPVEAKPTEGQDCSREHLLSIQDRQARSEQASKCMTGGSYKPHTPATF